MQTGNGCRLVPFTSWLWLLAVKRGYKHATGEFSLEVRCFLYLTLV